MSAAAVKPHEVGWAKIKPEYVLLDHKPVVNTEYVSPAVKKQLAEAANEGNDVNEPPSKRVKLKGRNKNRPKFNKAAEKVKLCPSIVAERECKFAEKCKYLHDIKTYIDAEPANIGPDCYLFQTFGKCQFGVTCRFSKSHLTEDLRNIVKDDIDSYKSREKAVTNVLSKDLQVKLWKRRYDFSRADKVLNSVAPGENDQRKRKELPMPVKPAPAAVDKSVSSESEKTVVEVTIKTSDTTGAGTEDQTETTPVVSNEGGDKNVKVDTDASNSTEKESVVEQAPTEVTQVPAEVSQAQSEADQPPSEASQASSTVGDAGKDDTGTNGGGSEAKIVDHGQSEGVIRLRPQEKKQINFMNKTYLAPLTTVGNLPFRRVCKGFGVDVTCGEMAVCTNLLQGQLSEWALLKRHESEDLFGVQLCGGYPDSMTRCAQLITETMDVDFIDINCGCPIDLIFNRGEGSALMGRHSKFEQIIKGMTSVMDIPLTVKVRTGIYSEKNIAHTLMPKLRDLGVCLTTIHGRSRVQRYTKTADWDYVGQCAAAAWPMPVFGNGDILSYEEVNTRRDQSCISGCMVARGALIKPWIFTEIKEQRHWDISANERFDMYKDFVHFGLDHWGSDTKGVENTRRFLLEWLSFTYRYIPVGLLERVPQQINERPPYYKGRNDLETLLASPSCEDWIKISEMLLGPVPEEFTFLPKHKANAYK